MELDEEILREVTMKFRGRDRGARRWIATERSGCRSKCFAKGAMFFFSMTSVQRCLISGVFSG